MFGFGKKTVQIRLLTMFVGVDEVRGPWHLDRGTVIEWDSKDAKRLCAAGYAKIVDADAPTDPLDVAPSTLPSA